MTLTATTVRVQYNGDGTTITFPVPYIFFDDDDLKVILTDADDVETTWVRGTQYTVSGGDGATGSVVAITTPTDYTPATGEKLTILSNLADTQLLSLPAGGALPSASLEEQLDKIVRMIQEKEETLGRALKFSESSPDTGVAYPDITGNASKYARVKADETGLEAVDLVATGTVSVPVSIAEGGTGATTAAGARTNLGVDASDARRDTAKRLAMFHHGGI